MKVETALTQRGNFKMQTGPNANDLAQPANCAKSELELTLNKLSAARRTGEPVALTPCQCEALLARLDELMFAIENSPQRREVRKVFQDKCLPKQL